MPVLIACPSCNRQLRVPDELIGRMVKCPSCQTTFQAQAGGAPAPVPVLPPAPAPPSYEDRPPEWEEEEEGRPRFRRRRRRDTSDAASMVKGPAICLIITGVLGVAINLFQVGWALYLMANPPPPPPARAMAARDNPFDELMRDQGEQAPFSLGAGVIFTITSVIVIVGAVMMIRLQMWGLALTGSIVAIVNIGNCCCILGLPFGIWALVVLCKEEVKEAFG